MTNIDRSTVEGFGREWRAFDQRALSPEARARLFAEYFAPFPWERLPTGATGADLGCGSGRWAIEVAPRVGRLHLVDASGEALEVARRNLADHPNCRFHQASIGALPAEVTDLDFAYSLGVLHHLPDTAAALSAIAQRLRPGAPLLVYLYYALDDRPAWYRALWRASDLMRRGVARLPFPARWAVSQLLALLCYWPLARTAGLLGRVGVLPRNWPLAAYRGRSFYVMRTDALDRFGTRLERRFTRAEAQRLLEDAGFQDVRFSERAPFWTAVGIRS